MEIATGSSVPVSAKNLNCELIIKESCVICYTLGLHVKESLEMCSTTEYLTVDYHLVCNNLFL